MHSKQNYKGKSEESNAKETKKSPTEGEQERPQAWDHCESPGGCQNANRVLMK